MKKILFAAMLFVTMGLNAQSLVYFKLSENGLFVAEDGKDFYVVPFEGKTAHQIFQQLSVNVSALYKNPSKVMSVVDDASITIRAYDDGITYTKDLIQKFYCGGYYNLNFQIKDGRVKVSAPIIDDKLDSNSGSVYFISTAKKWFKDGEVKSKSLAQVEYTEKNINKIINDILGSTKSQSEEDW